MIVWVAMFSGIAVQQHNIDNYNLRMIYHEQIVSVKPQKQIDNYNLRMIYHEQIVSVKPQKQKIKLK